MTFIEELEECKKLEERASNQMKNEMVLYFGEYEKWQSICKDAELEIENITITRKKK